MGRKIRKILYATDLSENSKQTLIYATDFAKHYEAEIVILHVIEEMSPTVHALLEGIAVDETIIKAHLNEKIINTIQRIKEYLSNYCTSELGCEVNRVKTIEVCEGHPEDQIVKKADAFDCDAIVMGIHGKGLFSIAIGSVTRRVLRQVKKPVFVIPVNGT